MDKAKIAKVIQNYREIFEARDIPKKEFPHDLFPTSEEEHLSHLHAMLDQMEVFLQEDKLDKTFRWLGFIQGCLWRMQIFTIEEMKNHNRS